MVKYYFFPTFFEQQLSEAEDSWVETPNSFVTLSGVYNKTTVLNEDNTLCYNLTIINEKQYIKKGFADSNGNIFTLIGFCLEADLETISPEYQAIIDEMPSILQFESSEIYLKWYNSIINA